MKRTTEMLITSCSVCPFYERTVLSLIADLVAKRQENTGACRFRSVGPNQLNGFPYGRVHVPDETKIPTACPLREGGAIVKIAEGA